MTRVSQAAVPEEGDHFQQVRRNMILTGWYNRVITLRLCYNYFTASNQIKASRLLIHACQTRIIFTIPRRAASDQSPTVAIKREQTGKLHTLWNWHCRTLTTKSSAKSLVPDGSSIVCVRRTVPLKTLVATVHMSPMSHIFKMS